MLAAVLLALAVPADDPKALIEKAVKAHGGAAALDKFPAHRLTVKGTVAVGGGDADMSGVILRATGVRSKQAATLSVQGNELPLVAVVNGDKVSLSVAGMPQELPDDRKADARLGAYTFDLTRLTPLLKADGPYTLKAGSAAGSVVVEHKEFKPVTLTFDPESGLLVKLSHPAKNEAGEEAERVTVYSDFKAVQGVQVAHKLSGTVGGKKQAELTAEKVELLEKVPEDEFAVSD